jgi:integrase
LRAAADEELIETNPAADVRPPKGEEREVPWTFLTLEEIDAVLSLRLRAEQRAIFTVAVFAGLRGGELWGLRWCDVHLDGDRCELVVCRSYRNATKSKRIRRVPLLPPALAALKTWRKLRPGVGEALVFPAASGGCHYRAFDAGWESAKRRAGIVRPVRFHDLRHTCASHLVIGSWTERPLRLEECRVWMGHSTIRVTERYSHLCPDWLHSLATPQNHEGIANLKKS